MKDILNNSMFFGVLVSILAYEVGVLLKKKFKFALLNPLLISIVIIILILVGFHIDYDTYNNSNVLQINQYFYWDVILLMIITSPLCINPLKRVIGSFM